MICAGNRPGGTLPRRLLCICRLAALPCRSRFARRERVSEAITVARGDLVNALTSRIFSLGHRRPAIASAV
jgi:hypothetical protein